MIHILTAVAPAASAAVVAAAAVWVLRYEVFAQAIPTVPGVLLAGAAGLAASALAILSWPETRREVLGVIGGLRRL